MKKIYLIVIVAGMVGFSFSVSAQSADTKKPSLTISEKTNNNNSKVSGNTKVKKATLSTAAKAPAKIKKQTSTKLPKQKTNSTPKLGVMNKKEK